ncbi:MAG: MoxR family ATPase [Candidatus Faecousia sp.]|nr:MoxR family ATPase [Candidatus Faecousia sp.]
MNRTNELLEQMNQVIVGKAEVLEKVWMAVLANGHILLDDVPGVGKTTLAVALGKALGMRYHRLQLTPDVLPSDIVGFSVYDKAGGGFRYMPGIVNDSNLLLADEINRTSSKTQSALLEAMEERQVTVDGTAHPLPEPFLVIATENHVGAAGTQLLPQAQLDRFLIRLHIGYPDFESQMQILRSHRLENPVEKVRPVADCAQVLQMQQQAAQVTMKDSILSYITRLTMASQQTELLELGISPRGAIAVGRMARACAFVRGRDYVIPADVREIFVDVCAHRVLPSQKAKAAQQSAQQVLAALLSQVPEPYAES